ncbi:ATP-binding protein, partial [Frankia canadensis]|uniref:ATP-binding protein n=1 Tax=Frankia canadensis TaxID=1836972 RepID=UPI001402AB72
TYRQLHQPHRPCEDAVPAAGVLTRPVRLVELPVGASEDRITGSLDLERALAEGVSVLRPGLLAAAHRGILYVDEVNLLGDHLVDLLLDAAAAGTVHVERDGVSARHRASFLLVGTMNPEEGELRPQLLDRFALTVHVAASRDPAIRAEVVRRRLAFDADPHGFAAAWEPAQTRLAAQVATAAARLRAVTLTDAALYAISAVCAGCDVDGMRADVVLARTARAHAAWNGHDTVRTADIRAGARLALPHRRRRGPFDAPDMDTALLDAVLDTALAGLDDAVDNEQTARRRATTADGPGHAADGTEASGRHPRGHDPVGGDADGEDPDGGDADGSAFGGDGPHGGAGPGGSGLGGPGGRWPEGGGDADTGDGRDIGAGGPDPSGALGTDRDSGRLNVPGWDGGRLHDRGGEDISPGRPGYDTTGLNQAGPGGDRVGGRADGTERDAYRRGGLSLTLPRTGHPPHPGAVGGGAVGVAPAPGALFRPRAFTLAGLGASTSAGRRSPARGQRGALVTTSPDAPGLHLPATRRTPAQAPPRPARTPP